MLAVRAERDRAYAIKVRAHAELTDVFARLPIPQNRFLVSKPNKQQLAIRAEGDGVST